MSAPSVQEAVEKAATEEILDALIGMYSDAYDRFDRQREIQPVVARIILDSAVSALESVAKEMCPCGGSEADCPAHEVYAALSRLRSGAGAGDEKKA